MLKPKAELQGITKEKLIQEIIENTTLNFDDQGA